ncbi:MAG: hypothetical protein HY754_14380 [Nitrospirae bacterium]|nr:hypothetical protein [Nitrospirota bacterium]
MGEKYYFQPLTGWDKATVVLYRAGIVLSAMIISIAAYIILYRHNIKLTGLGINTLIIALYVSVGLSVFFIHLYINKFKKALIKLYLISIACIIILFVIGKGDISGVLISKSYSPLLLIPLSGCLGFVTAKEAFCFKLMEGYLLALIMPLYIFLFSIGVMTSSIASYGLLLIAGMLVFFTLRKVIMPIHYDIGDKSAYT